MRLLLILLILLAAGGWVLYSRSPEARETYRDWRMDSSEKPSFDAFRQGREIFKSKWDKGSTAKFHAYGDEGEGGGPLVGDVYMAYGVADVDGGTPTPWCIVFNKSTGVDLGHATGDKVQPVVQRFSSGELARSLATPAPRTEAGSGPASPLTGGGILAPRATPQPGSWMWSKDHRGSLDQPAHRDGQR